MFDFEDVPGGFCDLLQYSFRFDQIMGVKGFDSTSKLVCSSPAKSIPPSGRRSIIPSVPTLQDETVAA
jgi:hypothetical protein